MRFFLRFLPACLLLVYSISAYAASFLTLADIHFDPYAGCERDHQRPCAFIQKLQQAPVSAWPKLLQENHIGLPMTKMGKDSHYYLLQSALNAAKATAETEKPLFVAVLGDFFRHHYRSNYQYFTKDKSQLHYEIFAKKTLAFLQNELQQTFPHTPIFPLVGNNDSYSGDYYTRATSSFFQDIAGLWLAGMHVSTEAKLNNQLAFAGYYALNAPHHPNLRLIFLNTVPFSYKATGPQQTALVHQELRWLHQELQAARRHQQRAFIFMHIPPAVDVYVTLRTRLFTLFDLWSKTNISLFQQEMREFQPQIAAVFAAHLHSNWYHMQSFGQSSMIISGTPAISPIFGNRPGFKFYQFTDPPVKLDSFTLETMQSHSDAWKQTLQLKID